jgi:adenine-specific DNA-methyltransferase
MLCDSVLGEENYVTSLIWQKKKGGSNDSRHVATEHEYILMYANHANLLQNIFIEYSDEYISRYKEKDDIGRFFWDTFKRKSGKQYYPIKCPDGTILQYEENGEPISWLRSESRFLSDLEAGETRIIKVNGKWTVHFKQRQPKGYMKKTERSVWLYITMILCCLSVYVLQFFMRLGISCLNIWSIAMLPKQKQISLQSMLLLRHR